VNLVSRRPSWVFHNSHATCFGEGLFLFFCSFRISKDAGQQNRPASPSFAPAGSDTQGCSSSTQRSGDSSYLLAGMDTTASAWLGPAQHFQHTIIFLSEKPPLRKSETFECFSRRSFFGHHLVTVIFQTIKNRTQQQSTLK